MKISSRHILKFAEVYGAEATVYTGSNSEPEDFLRFTVGGEWNPGHRAGSMYGRGLYSVYNLDGTGTSRGGYGRWIYKLRVNLYGFISFNEDVTQKIYGSKLKPSQQYRMVYGENKLILTLLEELEKNNVGIYTSVIAESASKFLRGIVKGILFTGGGDGDVAVIYDANVVTPISYRHLDGDGEWKKFEKEKVKESIGRGMAGSFEPKKYDKADEILSISVKNINSLSGDESKLDNKSLRYVYYLIKNNPIEFLNQFSEKPWAKEARPELNGKSYVDIAAKAYAEQKPEYFLYEFSEKPWAKPYIDSFAKASINKEPDSFLIHFSKKEWAKEARPELEGKSYVDIAAADIRVKTYIEQDPVHFLYHFPEEEWAKKKRIELGESSYVDIAAKAFINKHPSEFLEDFSEEGWAKEARSELNGNSYVGIAVKAFAEQEPYLFLYRFSEKPWAKTYINSFARAYIEQDPYSFLDSFSEKPWAEPYIADAARAYMEENLPGFLIHFSEKTWAKKARPELNEKSYVDIAAKAYAKQYPRDFLIDFSEEPWAKEAKQELDGKSYVDLAREALNAKNLNQTASQVNVKLLKLAEVLRSLKTEGLNKEISQIKDLARNRY